MSTSRTFIESSAHQFTACGTALNRALGLTRCGVQRRGPAIASSLCVTGREFYLWQVRSFTVRLALDTVDRIKAELSNPQRKQDEEQGGILLGRVVAPGVVEVTGFEFVASEHRRGIAYDMGSQERQRVGRYIQRLRQRVGPQPIGYFRTHERPGLFLDRDDLSMMKEAFSDSSSIALLIRPADSGAASAGFFTWEDGDIDARATRLSFPFDAEALHRQGPVSIDKTSAPVQSARRRVPAWQAFALASMAALAGFAFVAASSRTSPVVAPSVPVVEPAPVTPKPKPFEKPAAAPAVRAVIARPKVLIAVSMEPRGITDSRSSDFKKVVAHVPLLGRLHREDAGPFIPARPTSSLRPNVPVQMAANLSREFPVDVKVNIDRNGVVRNTEVLNGGGTRFSSLAADKAFWTSWQPARQGDEPVASQMIVHYRFTPAIGERQ